MGQKPRSARWKRFSPGYQKRSHRHEDRISRNPEYRDADRTSNGGGSSCSQDPPCDEVRQFYRMRLRDAAAFDRPWLRLAEFFDNDPSNVVQIEWTIPAVDVLMLSRALSHFLADWNELPATPNMCDLFRPLKHLAVEVKRGCWDHVPIECRRFWRHEDGRRLCVEIEEHTRGEFTVSFMVRKDEHQFARELWPKLECWMDANHYLKRQKICADGRLLPPQEGDVWERLILPPETKRSILENTVALFKRAEAHRRFQLPLRRGVLLHGPPGTGKTMIGRALAGDAESTFIVAAASDVEEPADVRRIFLLARRLAPTILFFEDLDLIGANRHGDGSRQVLGELLTCLDGIESPDGVVVVATTNDLGAIEPALKDRPSRFDVVLEVPPLDQTMGGLYIREWMDRRGISMPEGRADLLTRQRITGAEAQELCLAASLRAMERSSGSLAVTAEDFHHAEQCLRAERQPRIGFGG